MQNFYHFPCWLHVSLHQCRTVRWLSHVKPHTNLTKSVRTLTPCLLGQCFLLHVDSVSAESHSVLTMSMCSNSRQSMQSLNRRWLSQCFLTVLYVYSVNVESHSVLPQSTSSLTLHATQVEQDKMSQTWSKSSQLNISDTSFECLGEIKSYLERI